MRLSNVHLDGIVKHLGILPVGQVCDEGAAVGRSIPAVGLEGAKRDFS